MAYDLVRASTQYLTTGVVWDSATTNRTILARCRSDNHATFGNEAAVIGARDNPNNGWKLEIRSNGVFRFTHAGVADYNFSSGISEDVVYAVAVRIDASSNYAFYLNGSAAGTGTIGGYSSVGSRVLYIGDFNDKGSPAGSLWDGELWDIALYDGDIGAKGVAQFSAGVSPLLIRPDILTHYWPLVGSGLDVMGGDIASPVSSPTLVGNPSRVFFPSSSLAVPDEVDAGGGGDPAVLNTLSLTGVGT